MNAVSIEPTTFPDDEPMNDAGDDYARHTFHTSDARDDVHVGSPSLDSPNDFAPPPEGSENTATPVPVAAAQAIRFCRTCGAPWQPEWESCPACAARAAAPTVAAQVQAGYLSDRQHVRSATRLYFALLGVSLVTILVTLAAGGGERMGVTAEMLAELAMSVITLAWCSQRWRELLPALRPAEARWFFLAPLLACGTYLVASLAVGVLQRVVGVEKLTYLDSFKTGGYGMMMAVLLICVQPGVIEELAFRGVILGALRRVLSGGEAMLVSALMFAILHLSVPSIPHLFLLGLLLAWLRLRTGSLLPGMLLHFTHNLLVVLSEQHHAAHDSLFRSILPW